MSTGSKIRVGAVSYLNTKPLIESLEDRCPDIELSLDLPSRLAAQLAKGELDVALIPSVETFRLDGSIILSDACIGCRGPVWSVKLISRKPFEEIRTLALDEGSRTSVGLVQVLLQKKYNLRPLVSALPIDQELSQAKADAVLVIGDRAMHIEPDPFPFQWDLGEQWCRWTGLPFVFAMWVTLDPLPSPELIEALGSARDHGVALIEKIAEREASRYGLSVESCIRYLQSNLHFSIGEDERQALGLFQTYLHELNLIPDLKSLSFYECQTS